MRNRVCCFDSSLILTRGNPLGFPAFLSHLNPRNGIITGVVYPSGDEDPVVGQVKCVEGRRNARLTFLLPSDVHQSPALPVLLDGLAQHAGHWGAFGLLAEVDEMAAVFENLRRAGYSVFGWQRIYQIPAMGKSNFEQDAYWRFAEQGDEFSIRQLYQSLVPPLVQAADPLPSGRLYGLIHQSQGQILAYIESVYGPDGIYLRPLIHPDVKDIHSLLNSLEEHLTPLLGRKVYLAVRSYQSWLESPLAAMEADSTARQALMVKYLAATQRMSLANVHRAVIDDVGTEPSATQMVKKTKIGENEVK